MFCLQKIKWYLEQSYFVLFVTRIDNSNYCFCKLTPWFILGKNINSNILVVAVFGDGKRTHQEVRTFLNEIYPKPGSITQSWRVINKCVGTVNVTDQQKAGRINEAEYLIIIIWECTKLLESFWINRLEKLHSQKNQYIYNEMQFCIKYIMII